MVRGKEFFRMLRDLLFEEELDEEDVPLPAVIVEDNPEWLGLLAKTQLGKESKQEKKKNKGAGIALPTRSFRFF